MFFGLKKRGLRYIGLPLWVLLLSLASFSFVPMGIAKEPLSGVTTYRNNGKTIKLEKLYRENHNAHSYNVYIFSLDVLMPDGQTFRHIIPFELLPSRDLKEVILSNQGAECVLKDLFVEQTEDDLMEVVIAEREFGESFADDGKVTFQRFRLQFNEDGLAGLPAYYFELIETAQTDLRFCDVRRAYNRRRN